MLVLSCALRATLRMRMQRSFDDVLVAFDRVRGHVGGMSAASSAPAPARPLRAVLFDIDGTLFNSDEVHLEVFAEMLAEPWLTHK